MKYKLTKTKKEWCGVTLFQIQATASFGDVKNGELGGFIEKEENLSQDGNAWVYGNAQVSGNARVSGNAWVYGKLKLLAGYFFGIRYQKEEIKFEKLDDDYDLIYRGNAKFGEEEIPAKSLSGKVVKVEIEGIKYEAVIK